MRESDHEYRMRIGEALPNGSWYWAEELGEANADELDEIGDLFNVKRKVNDA